MPVQWGGEAAEVVLCWWPGAGFLAAGVVVPCQLCMLTSILTCRTNSYSTACLHKTSTPALVSFQDVVYCCKSVSFGGGLFVCMFVLEILGGFCFGDVGFSWDFVFGRNQAEIILVLFSHTIQFVYSSKK